MKFKENAIKPGRVIHCPKEEDAKALLEYLDDMGYIWEDPSDRLLDNTRYKEGDTYFLDYDKKDNGYRVTHDSYDWAIENGYTPTEFSDLIEPDDSPVNSDADSPMTAVEVVEWLSHFVIYDDYGGVFERLHDKYGDEYCFTDLVNEYTPKEIVQKITAYEAAKKKPKPVEIEFLLICHVYEWWGDEWKEVKRVEHIVDGNCENEYEIAKQDLLDYRQSPQWRYECYVISERRCRVKENE